MFALKSDFFTLRSSALLALFHFILAFSTTGFANEVVMPNSLGSSTKPFPQVQMHRGAWNEKFQENTIAAFEEAKNQGAKMIELDVQLSKDHQVVVFHDYDLKRLFGSDARVSSLTAAELKKMAHIPTLQEVLTDPKCPAMVNIELKQLEKNDLGLELATAKVIEKAKAQNRVIFSSFNEYALGRCAEHVRSVPRALLTARGNGENEDDFLKRVALPLETAKSHLIHMEFNGVSESLGKKMKAAGYKFNVWTVDKEEDAKTAIERGAASVISNNPKLIGILEKSKLNKSTTSIRPSKKSSGVR